MTNKSPPSRRRKRKRKASDFIKRPTPSSATTDESVDVASVDDSPESVRRSVAIIGLVVAVSIGLGIWAGIEKSPKDGIAVASALLFFSALFGALLRPPPLRERPGESTAIDFGRTEPQQTERPQSRSERRQAARSRAKS